MQQQELTAAIIGCAYRVHNTLGFGFLESVYEKSLLIELDRLGLQAENQHAVQVYYEQQCVGDFFVDILVQGTVLVELKAVQRLVKMHEVQLVNYLVATRLDVGLLLNFGPERVEVKRRVRNLDHAKRLP